MPMKDDFRNPFWDSRTDRKRPRWPWIVGVMACLAAGSFVLQYL